MHSQLESHYQSLSCGKPQKQETECSLTASMAPQGGSELQKHLHMMEQKLFMAEQEKKKLENQLINKKIIIAQLSSRSLEITKKYIQVCDLFNVQVDSTGTIQTEISNDKEEQEDNIRKKLASKVEKYKKRWENQHKSRELETAKYKKDLEIMESRGKTKELKTTATFHNAEEKLEALLAMVKNDSSKEKLIQEITVLQDLFLK